MTRYFAKKTECALGHKHDSKREAERCAELVLLFRAGKIQNLVFQPVYEFVIEGVLVTMLNGHPARYTSDFAYTENGKVVWEEVKPPKKRDKKGRLVRFGESRDVPLRLAFFRHLNPDIELRIVT